MTQPPTQPPAQPPPAPGGPPTMPQGGPPPATFGGPPVAGGAAYAEWWKRVVAALIDALIVGIPAGILMSIVTIGNAETVCDANGCRIEGGGFVTRYLITNLLFQLVWAGYQIYFNGSEKGQTVGKMAMKIRVRDEMTGGPIGYGKAGLRWIVGAAIGFFTCGIGALVDLLFPLWDPKKQTLHDKAANSIVVDVP